MNDFRDPTTKQEETRRLMLAIGISMGILLLWQSLFPPPPPPALTPSSEVAAPSPPEAAGSGAASEVTPASAVDQAAIGPDADVGAEAKTKPQMEPKIALATMRLQNERFEIVMSNRGAKPVLVALIDQAHGDVYREPGRAADRPVVDLASGREDFAAVKLPGLAADKTWRVIDSDASSVQFSTQVGDLTLTRKWVLHEHGLNQTLTLKAQAPASGSVGLALSMADPRLGGSMLSGPPDLPRSFCHDGKELGGRGVADLKDDLKDETESVAGAKSPEYFGVDRNFFAVVWSWAKAEECRLGLRQLPAAADGEDDKPIDIVTVTAQQPFSLAAGSSFVVEADLLILPKSDNYLAQIDPKLRDLIDFGVFKFIAQPMLWLLTWFFALVGNYGVAIILLTFTVKLILWPITDMSFRSMARMKEVQPQIAALREKYAGDKQALAQKQMELFKKEGVNPAGGCIPMLLQIPVWFALYSTLRVAVELYGSPFIPGWIDDLTLADPYYILPVLLGGLFFVQQRVQPQMGDNPQQQMMMKVMPVMMTVFMIALPSGLVVYILCNTVLGILHQLHAIKRDAKPA